MSELPTIDSLTQDQEQRILCLNFAAELSPVSTLDDRWKLARWLYDGTSS